MTGAGEGDVRAERAVWLDAGLLALRLGFGLRWLAGRRRRAAAREAETA